MGDSGGSGNGSRGSIDELLDQAPAEPPARPKRPDSPGPAVPASEATPVSLTVVWGDLCLVPADVHAVGHYQGVMPTSAEAALDEAISSGASSRRIIAEHTRRQWFLGDFGHVNYFPSTHKVVKLAAAAGMGRPGTFTEARCRRLSENLLVELCALGSAKHVALVGIGSGAGNLSIDEAARAMATGFDTALRSTRMTHPCTQIQVVEYDRLRAERFLEAFQVALAGQKSRLALDNEVQTGEGGGVSFASAAVYLLATAAERAAAADGSTDGLERALDALLGQGFASSVLGRLKGVDPANLRRAADVSLQQNRPDSGRPPVRISVLEHHNGRSLRVAAITGTATVPERQIDADRTLFDEIARRMSPPKPADIPWLAELMSRMVLPGDLQALVTSDTPLVFEVDRRTAQIHWELVADLVRSSSVPGDSPHTPLVLETSVSRQLRTTYSRVPALDAESTTGLHVLVVGDPGRGPHSLPGARREAEAVQAALTKLGIQVTALIGAPPEPGKGTSGRGGAQSKPAARLDVLGELISGAYQIIHYCGHGTFDPEDQTRAGWLFADGLLTSRELAQLGTPPRLVVANACFSSRLGASASTEAQLAPSLADEFFRAGAANYLGAAWMVADEEATLFSTTFYDHLLAKRDTIGDAITNARNAVWKKHPDGTTWAAYQHYGDPTDQLLVDERGGDGAP